jgi:formylglycine-generating enzyme required for sulfatase activity
MSRPVLACLAALALFGLAWLLPPGEAPAGESGKVLTNSIGMKLTRIPKGKFLMGSPETEKERDEGELQHEVEISKPFYLGVHEVTQSEYARVMGKKPRPRGAPVGEGPDFPTANVEWGDAVNFCQRLTALPAEKLAGRKYRLPTEAEWEYACRAGTTTPFSFGSSLSAKQANFNGDFPYGGADKGPYLRRTAKVGSYAPNAWGLYDMHGNVAEWCADFYDKDYYPKSPKVDPTGPAKGAHPTGFTSRTVPGPGQFYRVIRGGSWLDEARGCRSAYRFRAMPHEPYQMIGLRVVCEVEAGGR